MKQLFFFLFLLILIAPVHAETLTYEGKVIAEISRNVTLPFPILVDQVLAGIGENIQKGQKLLAYTLEAREARQFQAELLTGGALADLQMQKSHIDQELLQNSMQRQLASELAAKGLGAAAETARTGKALAIVKNRLDAVRQKIDSSRADFALRLEELEGYFGHKLKIGDKLPRQCFLPAPISATVVNISPQARPGGFIDANAMIFSLAVLNPIQIQIQVYESEISRLKAGMPVNVEVANNADLKLSGKVAMLSWQPTDNTIAVPSFYFVYMDVENPDHVLKPGYKVLVHIPIDG